MSIMKKFRPKPSVGESSCRNDDEVTTFSKVAEHLDAPGLHVLYDSARAFSTSPIQNGEDSCLAHVEYALRRQMHGLSSTRPY